MMILFCALSHSTFRQRNDHYFHYIFMIFTMMMFTKTKAASVAATISHFHDISYKLNCFSACKRDISTKSAHNSSHKWQYFPYSFAMSAQSKAYSKFVASCLSKTCRMLSQHHTWAIVFTLRSSSNHNIAHVYCVYCILSIYALLMCQTRFFFWYAQQNLQIAHTQNK